MPKSVVTFSGGLDSSVLLAHLCSLGHEIIALSIDYGQRHRIELEYASRLARRLQVRHQIADLRGLSPLLRGSSLTDASMQIPQGHYESQSMKQTVVPNRNMLLLAAATSLAVSEKADYVAYAAHAGDHAIYPDCRSEFADAMAKAINLCDWHAPQLIRPFIEKTKADIVREGAALHVPFELTWSCYEGGQVHCGGCGTCIERREAFMLAKIADPTYYAESAPALKLSGATLDIDFNQTATKPH